MAEERPEDSLVPSDETVDSDQLEMIHSKEAHPDVVILESVSLGAISKPPAYSLIFLVTHVFMTDEMLVVYLGSRHSNVVVRLLDNFLFVCELNSVTRVSIILTSIV